jgi:hypothetical protein
MGSGFVRSNSTSSLPFRRSLSYHRPSGYNTQPEIQILSRLDSAKIVTGLRALGSGTLRGPRPVSLHASPTCKLMRLQDAVRTQRHHPKGLTPTASPHPTPQALFALLSPLLSQAFASLSLAVLPDSPIDPSSGTPRARVVAFRPPPS